ncbi:MAG: hypothetical protein PVI99_00190 [Anaerolineales bacterium]|jgi:hypothetical protein
MRDLTKPLILITVLAFGLSACASEVSGPEATAQALKDLISLTSTAAALEPTAAEGIVATAGAVATDSGQAATATQLAIEATETASQAATATVEAPFIEELSLYGIDPSDGHMGWIHPPATLDIEGYMQYGYTNQFFGTVVSDFVVAADITWDTGGGISGCGFAFRADGNEEDPNQYLAVATRSGNGRVIFSAMVDGEVKNVVDHYAYAKDPLMDYHDGATNRLAVVARGSLFEFYTNGTKVGEVIAGEQPVLVLPPAPTPPPADSADEVIAAYDDELKEYEDQVAFMQARHQENLAIFQPETPYFERGFLAMVVLSEADRTICYFDNAFLWILDE